MNDVVVSVDGDGWRPALVPLLHLQRRREKLLISLQSPTTHNILLLFHQLTERERETFKFNANHRLTAYNYVTRIIINHARDFPMLICILKTHSLPTSKRRAMVRYGEKHVNED